MTRTRRIAVLATAVLSVVAIGACHHRHPGSGAGPGDAGRRTERGQPRRAQADAARRAAAGCSASPQPRTALPRRPPRAKPQPTPARCAATLTAMVHFDYDQSELRPGDRAILDAKVPILQANSGVMIRIAGHTDERGSDEYNLALGQRRAAAAKAYLVQHGIADARIETISYGEEHPSRKGRRVAFSQNRRAEFEITSGGNNLRSP